MPPKVNKIEVEMKRLSKLDGNKICADCPEKMPTYVDLTHNVFICTRCAGIHRDSQFKIKGISMSVFTEDDVKAIASGGNESSNSVLLARIGDYSVPNGNDVNKLKDFIKLKYVDKKWTVGGGSHSTTSSRDFGNSNINHSNNYSSDSNHRSSQPSGGHFATPSNGSGGGNDGWGDNNDSWGDNGNDAFADNNTHDRRSSASGSSAPIVIKSLGNVGKTASGSRRASTGTFSIKPATTPAHSTHSAAPDMSLDLLSLDEQPVAKDPWAAPQSSAAPSNFDPFGGGGGGPAPAAAPTNFDPFGSTPVKSNANANAAFDPFASSTTPQQQQGQGQQQRAPQSGGFDAFGPQSAPPQQNGFNAFGSPPPQQQQQFGGFNAPPPMPMPFIQISKPVAPAPVAAPVVPAAAPVAGPKNFSVFDELVPVPVVAPPQAAPGPNPFDTHNNNPFGGPAQAPRGPPQQQPYPGQYPPQGHGPPAGYGAPHPGYPGAPYPPQQGGPPGPYGAYPPQPGFPGGPPPQGYPPHGYPPQGPPGGFQGYPPQPGYPPQQGQGYPPQQQYPPYGAPGGPPQGYPGQQQQPPPQQAPPVAVAPDPFASMSGLAWSSAGGAAPSSQPRPQPTAGPPQQQQQQYAPAGAPQQYGAPPQQFGAPQPQFGAPPQQQQYAPAPTQQYQAPPAPAAAASVNPFDMF